VRTQRRLPVPCRHSTRSTDNKTEDAKQQRVGHGPFGRESRSDVAAPNAIQSPVEGREQQGRIARRLTQLREHPNGLHQNVSANGENYADE